MQEAIAARDAELEAARREVESLRGELQAAAERAQTEQEARESEQQAARTRELKHAAELDRLRARNRELSAHAEAASAQAARNSRASEAAAAATSLAATVEGELVLLLERVHAARVETDASLKALDGYGGPLGGPHTHAHASAMLRSPPRSRPPPSSSQHKLGADAPHLSLPPIADADEERHARGRGSPPDSQHMPLRARVEWVESAAGGEDDCDDGDACSAGEGGEGGETYTRRANSSAPFDTLSQASLNTDDGRLTFTNSEYTQHLGALSDQEDENAHPNQHGSPRSSVSAGGGGGGHVEPLTLPPATQQLARRGGTLGEQHGRSGGGRAQAGAPSSDT